MVEVISPAYLGAISSDRKKTLRNIPRIQPLPAEKFVKSHCPDEKMTCLKVPRIKFPFDNSEVDAELEVLKDPCHSRKTGFLLLRAHKTYWPLIVVLLAFLVSTSGVYSAKDPTAGNCRYDLTSVASLSCLQPNGALRPPSLSCCNALLHAIDDVPANNQSGACCLCRYMRDKQSAHELAKAYVHCGGKDKYFVKEWSSFHAIKCSVECRKRRISSPGMSISAHEDQAKGVFHILWAIAVMFVLMGLICLLYFWRIKLATNASEQGGKFSLKGQPQGDSRGSPGFRSSTKRRGRRS